MDYRRPVQRDHLGDSHALVSYHMVSLNEISRNLHGVVLKGVVIGSGVLIEGYFEQVQLKFNKFA